MDGRDEVGVIEGNSLSHQPCDEALVRLVAAVEDRRLMGDLTLLEARS